MRDGRASGRDGDAEAGRVFLLTVVSLPEWGESQSRTELADFMRSSFSIAKFSELFKMPQDCKVSKFEYLGFIEFARIY